MTLLHTRYLVALLAATALSGTAALAAPPAGVDAGIGAHAGAGVGAPPIGVPPVRVPPLVTPPLSVPKPQSAVPASTNPNARLNGSASATVAANVMHGTLTALGATSATVRLSDGTLQNFSVSAQTGAQLRSYVNKNIAFRVVNGMLALAGNGVAPLHGTLLALSGSVARMKLANGATQAYTVTQRQAAWLRSHLGKRVTFWSESNGSIDVDEGARGSGADRAKL